MESTRTTPDVFDVIVVGVGAMGSAALYHLSKVPNLKILGLDQFFPPHIYGSSHGETRITRQIYAEHPNYVPLVKKTYPMWNVLEDETKTKLFEKTGGLYMGEENSEVITGLKKTAKEHNFDIKLMKNEEINKKFPAFRIPENMMGVFDPTAGILFAEKCIQGFIGEAEKRGVVLNFGEKVLEITKRDNQECVVTDKRTYLGKKIIISAGAYVTSLLKNDNLPLKIEKKKLFWLEPKAGFKKDFDVPNLPIYLIEDAKMQVKFYGFPNIMGTGVKTALHVNKDDEIDNPYKVDRMVTLQDEKEFSEKISYYMPNLCGKTNKIATCFYTLTPDEHFIIDFLPRNKNIILASPCSGHGFKFSIVIGEILKDLVISGKSEFDLSMFSLRRDFKAKL